MSRWSWLKNREQKLKSGSLEDLYADIEYCRTREKIAKLKSSVKTWQQRRAEAEKAVAERFGEEVLEKWRRH
jgi:hypothetical protein